MGNFFERIGAIDRRILYGVLSLAVIVPLLMKARVTFEALPEVQQAYAEMERLDENSTLLVSIDYDAASMPELQPMLHSVLQHAFSKNVKVVMMGHWPLGLPLGQIALEQEAENFGKVYGEDYVFLGYRPGLIAVMINLGKDVRSVFSTDYTGTLLDSIPMMQNIRNYDQFDLLVGFEAGRVGDYWAMYANARYGQRMIMGATAVTAPDFYPFLQAGQFAGLMGGLRGAADYEVLLENAGAGALGMVPQTAVHILIVAFILIGNIGYFAAQRRKR
jgi:hypothetical protein